MFGISFDELVLLLVLALILFGPEKLPEFAQKLAHWVAKLRQASSDLSQHYQQVLNPALPSPQTPLPREEFSCPHCSRPMEERFTFCPHCGRSHEEEMPLEDDLEEPPWYVCPKCERDLSPDFLFCPACGGQRVEGAEHYRSPRPSPPPGLITCPRCARKVDTDLLFCPGCGHTLEKETEAPKPLENTPNSGLAGKGQEA